ncbi:MAG TPA: DsbA family protein [Stellaceae bacterium]|jgi:protein-disulfide isomerase
MRQIWFALAAFALLGGVSAAAPAHAESAPQQQPDDRVLGKADAPVTMFEFFSLTCPHCAEFEAETYPKVRKDWVDTGKAKIVYRDYPLDQNALKAAMVARCAPPERYAAFVEVLFQQQAVWGVQKDPTDTLKKIAALGGVGADQFDKCINDEALSKSIVAEEYQAQQDYGVDSTPSFFINGKKYVGAAPYAPTNSDGSKANPSEWYAETALSEAYAAATKHSSAAPGTMTASAQSDNNN